MTLEQWRDQMQRSHDVLHRDNATYRRMRRFGMVVEDRRRIVFYFERLEQGMDQPKQLVDGFVAAIPEA